jgi:hypothetical protein
MRCITTFGVVYGLAWKAVTSSPRLGHVLPRFRFCFCAIYPLQHSLCGCASYHVKPFGARLLLAHGLDSSRLFSLYLSAEPELRLYISFINISPVGTMDSWMASFDSHLFVCVCPASVPLSRIDVPLLAWARVVLRTVKGRCLCTFGFAPSPSSRCWYVRLCRCMLALGQRVAC